MCARTGAAGVDRRWQLFWNGESVDSGQFASRLKASAVLQLQPELHIRAERTTPYERAAHVMSDAARRGLTRIGFVTDPSAGKQAMAGLAKRAVSAAFQLLSGLACKKGNHPSQIEELREQKTQLAL